MEKAANDAATGTAAAADAAARKAAEERAAAKAATARKEAAAGIEFAATARMAAAAGNEFCEAENAKAYDSRKAVVAEVAYRRGLSARGIAILRDLLFRYQRAEVAPMAYATERFHSHKLRLFRCSKFDLSTMSASDQNNKLLINKTTNK